MWILNFKIVFQYSFFGGHLYAVGGVLFIVDFTVGLVDWLFFFFEESPISVFFSLMDGPGLQARV